jgi:hypothetical protein
LKEKILATLLEIEKNFIKAGQKLSCKQLYFFLFLSKLCLSNLALFHSAKFKVKNHNLMNNNKNLNNFDFFLYILLYKDLKDIWNSLFLIKNILLDKYRHKPFLILNEYLGSFQCTEEKKKWKKKNNNIIFNLNKLILSLF